MSGRDELRAVLTRRKSDVSVIEELKHQTELKDWMKKFVGPLCSALAAKFGNDSTVKRVWLSDIQSKIPDLRIDDFSELDVLRRELYKHFNGRVRVEGDPNTIGYFFQIV